LLVEKKTDMLFKIMKSNHVPSREISGTFIGMQDFMPTDAGRFQTYLISRRDSWCIFRCVRSHAGGVIYAFQGLGKRF
jgi:hypothetical protein